jgi:iron complex outermembrane recepter protein
MRLMIFMNCTFLKKLADSCAPARCKMPLAENRQPIFFNRGFMRSRSFATSSTLVGVAASICFSVAHAAEPLDEVVVTATRQSQSLRDYAGSASVMSAEDVALVGPTHHSEILNRVPGAMIQRNSGQESLTAIRSPVLSGPGSCGTFLFLENSVSIRPVGFCNVNEMFELNFEEASAIEVLRGPVGVVYGSGAMHGAINVLQPTPASMNPGVSLEIGPDEFYRGRGTLRMLGTNTDVGGSVVATTDGGWRNQTGLDEQKLNLSLAHRGDGSTFTLDLSATNLSQETGGFIQGENSYRVESLAKSNANPEAYRDAYAVRLVGGYTTTLGDGIALAVRPYARYSRMDFIQHFLIGKPYEDNGQDSLGVLTSVNLTAFTNTDVLAGVDLETAQGFLKETQPGPATDGAAQANLIRPAGKHYDYEVDSRVAAAYGQVTQPIGDSFKLTGGARVEYIEYDYDNKMIAGNTRDNGTNCTVTGCLYSRPADRKDDFTNVTARVGGIYAITQNLSVYSSVARAYRAPDTSELYRLQRQQSLADLDPERIDSIELGVRGDVGPVTYSVAAFKMKKDNVIFRDSGGFNVSDGRTDHEGVEYELAWRPIDTLTIAGAGTYAKHTYDFNRAVDGGETIVSGRDIDTAPRHVNTARIDWRFVPKANAELEWQSVGSYFVDAQNAHEYGGHDLINLRLGYSFLDNWGATLRINNLTDRAYADRADYAFGNYRYFPGRGRSAFVEVKYNF